ncbi:MAG: hypothetical protein A2063_04480 [Gallionellales bacterium GWA2_60_142]|jgi:hypothetical protein|nr:MAG: hypothetical protein A2063_04480 [Gallionellales bacterium GWA2_60_142]HCI12999.1 hypothetical protein [Gallionellaceae bacterium]
MMDFINLILEPLQEMLLRFKEFLPNLLAMLVIIGIGLLLAKLLRAILLKFLAAVGFDSWSDRMGFTTLMRKGDLWVKPSVVVGAVAFWMLAIVTLMVGLSALRVAAIDSMVGEFFSYLPRVFSATMILLIGYVVSGFVSRAVLIAAANAGFHYAKLLGEVIRALLMLMILAMVMEQLQIATSIVLAAFSITFGGVVVALAIAFGVGGIGAAQRIIEREIAEEKPKENQDDIEHI